MTHAPFALAIVFLSVVASVLSYLALNRALEVLPVRATAALINFSTVVSVLAGVLLLREPFGWVSAVASAVILVGIWGVRASPRPRCGYRRERRTAVPVVNGPGLCPTSSLVCFCITCQEIFSPSEKASQRALRCTRALHRTAAITHPAANAHQATPCPPITGTTPNAPGRSAAPAPAPSAANPVFHNLSTEFSTISPVFHSGFLSPWLSLRETG